MSDLEEKIRWCRENDDKCKVIGENAKKFYEKYVARDALLDYVQAVCNQISKRFMQPPKWFSEAPAEEEPPSLRKPDAKCFEDKKTGKSRLCVRCKHEEDEERKEAFDKVNVMILLMYISVVSIELIKCIFVKQTRIQSPQKWRRTAPIFVVCCVRGQSNQ